jgi:hypothetical protein
MALLVLATACGEGAATTTSLSSAPSTTAEPSSLTSQDVAIAFFEAWEAGDRQSMADLSEASALVQAESLAGLAAEAWEPELCEGAAGTVHCIWVSEAGTLAIGVQNLEEPHLVRSFELLDP